MDITNNWLEAFKLQLNCGTYPAKTANPKMEMLTGLVGLAIENLLCECPDALDIEPVDSIYGSGLVQNAANANINTIYDNIKCGKLFTSEGQAFAALAMVKKLTLECCEAREEAEDEKNEDVVNNQTGTAYEFELDDANETITFSNANPVAATVPTNANVPFSLGTELQLINLGAGDVEITPDSGVTVTAPGGNLTMSANPHSATLKKIATNQWVVIAAYPDLT